MNRKRCYLIVQSVLILALAALLSFFTIKLYQEGTARKSENVLEAVFRPGDVAGKLTAAAPLAFILIGTSAAGLLLDIKDDKAERPVKDAEAIRKLTAGTAPKPGVPAEKTMKKERSLFPLQMAVLAAALFFIIAGVMNRSASDVFVKAAKICTECIGLG